MASLLHSLVARIRGFLRPGELDREFEQELAAHLAMAEEEKVRQGMSREEARRAARLELGGLTQLREAGREARGLPWLDTFWLDIKLGLRMLRKSWGLTLVGGLAMTIAITIGVIVFTFLDLTFGGNLPLDEGDRVVAIQTWDGKASRRRETPLRDLERWRDTLRSVEDFGAFQTVERNLIIDHSAAGDSPAADGPAAPVFIAEMTASGFRLARIPALLGRTLVAEDEGAAAAPVVVIGYDVWQSRFAADPAIVGRSIRLGDTVHTVVGVMPEGFAFPVNHGFWTPLRAARSDRLPPAPDGSIFARLAPGFTPAGAQAELSTLGLLPSTEAEEADDERQARLMAYPLAFTSDIDSEQARWAIRVVLFLVTLILIPPCANIAILVYARTITRQEEFAARYALGASRSRIVGQLFIEMLVLAAAAAGVALVVVHLALERVEATMLQHVSGGPPFWMDFSLSLPTVVFAALLAIFAALVAGLVPALEATGRQMRSGLQALGRNRMQLGATWTALVVVQVAVCLAALPAVVEMTWGTIRKGVLGPGFAAEDYLTARLAMDREPLRSAAAEAGPQPAASRFATLQAELIRQLKAEPGVRGVTVASLPGDEPWKHIEIDGEPQEEGILSSHRLVRVNHVDDAFFEVFDFPLLAGSGFAAGDFDPPRNVVIVNRTFAQQLVGEGKALGRRVRYSPEKGEETSASQTWYEIVGVVADRPANVDRGTMYHPMAAGQMHPARLAVRVGGDPASMADRLREITRTLDPTLRVDAVLSLAEIYRQKEIGNNIGAFSLAAVTLSVLLLSAAGMYALMSFTVNHRRREIGIRSALGAQPSFLLAGIFKRALGQLAAGAFGGVLVALLLDHYMPAEKLGGWPVPGVIPTAMAFMIVVGLLAAAGPARRAMRVDPIAELREG